MKRFADAGISLNCQIVLCKGVNDGAELDRTMRDLTSYVPSLLGVAIVPAGLPDHRDGLFKLEPYTPDEAGRIIDQVDAFAAECLEKYDSRLFFCADEFYLKAGRELPDDDYYEGYPQLEDGVGMIRSMQTEFDDELEYISDYDLNKPRSLSIATGYAAYDFISSLVARLKAVSPNLDCEVYRIRNDFFGHNITVAGLVTGRDIVSQLDGHTLGDRLLIPSVMLRHERDRFLDDLTTDELSKRLGVKLVTVESNGAEFIEKMLY